MDDMTQKAEATFAAILREFDRRFLYFDVTTRVKGNTLIVEGIVHYPQLAKAAVHSLSRVFPRLKIQSKIKVLTRDWALRFAEVIPPCVMGLFRPNGAPEEATTELLAGQIIRIFFKRGDWILCQASDGYIGWIPAKSVRPTTPGRYLKWSHGRRWRLLAPWRDRNRNEYRVGSEFTLTTQGRIQIPALKGTIVPPAGEVVDPSFNPLRERVIEIGRSFLGVPYLWGGRTDQGLDCSGFIQVIYSRVGIALPRDANQQSDMGLLVGQLPDCSDLIPGDLLFFMSPETAKIYHVGISMGGDHFIHSASKTGVIEAHLLNHKSRKAMQPYASNFCFARRVLV